MRSASLVIGCGYTSQRELCHGDPIICLDIDKKKLYVARKRDPIAHYIVCDARLLPFREGGFYDVVCTDVLEHIINYEVVLKEILRLKPKLIYLRFPTEAREKLLTSFSRVYREEHWGKIHVRIVNLKEVVKLLSDQGYIVNIEPTSARSTLQRIFCQKMLEILRFPYKIPDVGLIEVQAETSIYKFILRLSMIIGILGDINYFIWRLFKVQTLHDNYIVSAIYRSR